MKCLSKIIFINSAQIPYAEVKLDGNVHFIGTQGVGKSTLLRAILFFYNADKMKLGIPKERETFDSYYFKYPNSFIIYEVMRPNGAFCVLATKSNGRVNFRFIDAPYQRSWFMDLENRAYTSFPQIREQIDSDIQVSNLVTRNEQYRDIIFGNHPKGDASFRRYALLESNKYQNIPRTIQNVFLNTTLDAQFIKETIISAMNEEGYHIDLDFFRNQTKDFEQQYEDVNKWFKSSKGENKVRRQANQVLEDRRHLISCEKHIKQLYSALKYAYDQATQRIPEIEQQIKLSESDLEKEKQQYDLLDKKYRNKQTALNSQLGVVNEYFRKLLEKKSYYDKIGIREIQRRCSQKDNLRQEQLQWDETRKTLLGQSQNIERKYADLINDWNRQMKEFELDIQMTINEKREAFFKAETRIKDTQREEELRLQATFHVIQKKQNSEINRSEKAHGKLDGERKSISYQEIYKSEKKACQEKIHALNLMHQQTQNDLSQQESDLESLETKLEIEELSTKTLFEKAHFPIQEKKKQLEIEIFNLTELIDRREGSLCSWLDENLSDWKDTIGKVADVETILYANNLYPRFAQTEESSSFFGIHLDVSQIDRTVRTPEVLQEEKRDLESRVSNLNNELKTHQDMHHATLLELKKSYADKKKDILQRKKDLEYQVLQFPQRNNTLKLALSEYIEKEENWRQEQMLKINEKIQEEIFIKNNAKEELKSAELSFTTNLKSLGERTKELLLDEKKVFDDFIAVQTFALEQKRTDVQAFVAELDNQKYQELAGQGLDANQIRACEEKLAAIIKELRYIEKNQKDLFGFEKDKEEYFNLETTRTQEKTRLEQEITGLRKEYNQEKERYDSVKKTLEGQLDQAYKLKIILIDGQKAHSEFLGNECYKQEYQLCEAESSEYSCRELIDQLRDKYESKRQQTDKLKKSINLFKSNFSHGNLFQFKIDLFTDADYFHFAERLEEFMLHNKIDLFKERVSSLYTDIMLRVSQEVGGLMKYQGDIKKLILAVNNDFIKRNFAGVIKEIALRADAPSDSLLLHLIEMKKFNDECDGQIGHTDLFMQEAGTLAQNNQKVLNYLLAFTKKLSDESQRTKISLSDTFQLKFKVRENSNDTGWVEKITSVGSEGTDVLVKAMVNIMLINVFKERASKRSGGDFQIHCMMDEIGRLHPNNMKGVLEFANSRNILLINGSPISNDISNYRYVYILNKDEKSNTIVRSLVAKR